MWRVFLLFVLISCGERSDLSSLQEAMDRANDPKWIPGAISSLTYTFSDLPSSASVSRLWGGNWYPHAKGGTMPTMKKYDEATKSKAFEWESASIQRHANVPWAGHCNGLAAAGIMTEEPTRSVLYNGVTFTAEDVKALLVESWQGSGYIIGGRCERDKVTYDTYGRIVESECRDVNPATFHLALTNYLGLFGKPIIVDVDNSEAVWNYAVVDYSFTSTNLSLLEAASLLNTPTHYVFNSSAVDIVRVVISVNYLNFSKRQYEYVLELDQKGQIIGGEWLGDSRNNHPDFIWRPLDPKPENPHLDLNIVTEIYLKSVMN